MNGQLVAVAVTFAAMAVSMIGAPYPQEIRLQHAPTAVALLALAVVARRRWLSSGAMACVLGFWWLHILGARWIYTMVPYDVWAEALFGRSLSELMGWRRNHYDRLVHFMFGVLALPAFAEVIRRGGNQRRAAVVGLAVAAVMAAGSAYEILEWQLATWLSPDQAEAYNGQQGDAWDAQKDMALAALGSLLSGAALVARRRRDESAGRA